jgi:YVTN family beta-propeller protein
VEVGESSARDKGDIDMGRIVVTTLMALAMLLKPDLHHSGPLAAAPKVYVGLFRDNAVAVIDSASNRVLSTIAVPKGPHGLVVTPDGRKVYVSSDGDSTVTVIDTATDRAVGTVDVGPNPHGLAMSPDGALVLVSAWGANQATFIDTATERIVGRVPVAQAHNGAISTDGRVAWVGSQQQGATALVRIDVASLKETARVPLDRTPRALDLSPDGRRLYFTVAGLSAVQVLDTATNGVTGQIAVGASPHQAPVTRDGRWALVPSQGPGELGIIDAASGVVAGTIAVGKTPHWVAATSDGRTAYVANEGSNDVSVVDLVARTVVATIPVGNAPRKIAVQPGPVRSAGSAAPIAVPGKVKTIDGLPIADHGTLNVKDATEATLWADDYYFAPTFLEGRAGQRLRLRVENAASTLHNLSATALSLDRDLPPRGRVEIDVVLPLSGPVHFFCKFHAPMGQNGLFLVAATH